MRTHWAPFLFSCSVLRRDESSAITSGFLEARFQPMRYLHQRPTPTMTSADFCLISSPVARQGAVKRLFVVRILLSFLCFLAQFQANRFPETAGTWFTGCFGEHALNRRVRQISPDKSVNFRYTTAAFTLSSESGALSCCADSPEDWALYAVSVRRLIALHSGFLQTVPRGSALAFG